ncbi:hypothetical protein QTN47_17195 [Danxiaibacter flavus]|uniref:Uncharacterized protein n=1 Tax=Danxiaibacter flavus TaxID=3049108 RepID=A0ABV3ZJC5_9BACT|nr:hypothetical protein QNM32_17205 [Chitinophagaceae bacterium DXS]
MQNKKHIAPAAQDKSIARQAIQGMVAEADSQTTVSESVVITRDELARYKVMEKMCESMVSNFRSGMKLNHYTNYAEGWSVDKICDFFSSHAFREMVALYANTYDVFIATGMDDYVDHLMTGLKHMICGVIDKDEEVSEYLEVNRLRLGNMIQTNNEIIRFLNSSEQIVRHARYCFENFRNKNSEDE